MNLFKQNIRVNSYVSKDIKKKQMKQIKLILLLIDQEDAINEDDSLIRFFTSINDSDKNYKNDKNMLIVL